MTRLRTEDIEHIVAELEAYDRRLVHSTGKTLKELALHAVGMSVSDFLELVKSHKVGVVSLTCGQGVIPRFAATVCEIVRHLGFQCFVPNKSDAAGIAEAFKKRADILLLADDDRFVAINTQTKRVSDNSEMTAKGFVAGLDLMAHGVGGKPVLVIGCGTVGRHAIKSLVAMGAKVTVCDIDPGFAESLQREIMEQADTAIRIDNSWRSTPEAYRHIIDATPSTDLIDASLITEETYIAVPGVPCGVTPEARQLLADRYLHDSLQIGTATMVIDACKQ